MDEPAAPMVRLADVLAAWWPARLCRRRRDDTDPPPAGVEVERDDPWLEQQDLVLRLRTGYGHADAVFDAQLRPALGGLADWLHRLPSAPSGPEARPGGALRRCLQLSLRCLQAADGISFGATESQAPEPRQTHRWRLACALAGLYLQVPELVAQLEVRNERGALWPGRWLPLRPWLQHTGCRRYRARWREAEGSQGLLDASWPAIRTLPAATLEFLAHDDGEVLRRLLECLARQPGAGNPITEVVERVRAAMPERPPPPPAGADATSTTPLLLERALRQALRDCFRLPDWHPNAPGGLSWWGRDGLYLAWPGAAPTLRQRLPAEVHKHCPDASALLAALAATRCIDAGNGALEWRIRPPGQSQPATALRLHRPQTWLGEALAGAAPLDQCFGPQGPRTDGQTLQLFPAAAPDDDADPGGAPDGDAPAQLTAGLLNPLVRDVMRQLLGQSQAGALPAPAHWTDAGLFVPLELLGPPPLQATVVRELAGAGWLVPADDGSRLWRLAGPDQTRPAEGVVLPRQRLPRSIDAPPGGRCGATPQNAAGSSATPCAPAPSLEPIDAVPSTPPGSDGPR